MEVRVASSFCQRLLGLMFRRQPPPFIMVFHGTRAVHTCWMRFPIDIVALNREGRVLEVRKAVPPWRVVVFPKGTWAVAEMAAGEAARLQLIPGTSLFERQGERG